MEALLKKLNYKGESEVLVLNAPEQFAGLLAAISSQAHCIGNLKDIGQVPRIDFALIFVLNQKAIDETLPLIYDRLHGDIVLWFCYLKKSSKKYKSDVDRDHGWATLGQYGFEPVRQVALDEDFSALRFRRVEYIKSITRGQGMVLTEDAKKRTNR